MDGEDVRELALIAGAVTVNLCILIAMLGLEILVGANFPLLLILTIPLGIFLAIFVITFVMAFVYERT